MLEDILEASSKIKDYTVNLSYEEFQKDDKTKDAVVRNFEIIGEAANRLPNTFREKHRHIEWLRIIGKLISDIGTLMKELNS
ncbi:MAG: DUF86 domain-containing protein [Ignavibacteriae bacterium]|nr:DUF86 domain-containing protein [Ignavibacteriota bacterium]